MPSTLRETPNSPVVGTSGANAERLGSVMAIRRTAPRCTNAWTDAKSTSAKSISPPAIATEVGPLPL
ncbi:hypothetical protein D3C71_1687740 [compost metagenome]